jgi:hypothetical protein
MPRPVEGDRCPQFGDECCGRLMLKLDGDCCCGAVRAPCSACEGCYLVCDDCGWDTRDAPSFADHSRSPLSAILADALRKTE